MRAPYWELGRPGKLRSRVECGRKHCSVCGRWRLVVDFDPVRGGGAPRSCCTNCRRRVQRQAWRQRTPEQIELRREWFRIYREVHRRQAGVALRTRRRGSVVDRVERVLLPAEPIAAELAALNGELATLSKRSGVSERTIGRLVSGESRHVRIDVADKLALAIGTPSAVIWGDEW